MRELNFEESFYFTRNSLALSPSKDESRIIKKVERFIKDNPLFDIMPPVVFKGHDLDEYILGGMRCKYTTPTEEAKWEDVPEYSEHKPTTSNSAENWPTLTITIETEEISDLTQIISKNGSIANPDDDVIKDIVNEATNLMDDNEYQIRLVDTVIDNYLMDILMSDAVIEKLEKDVEDDMTAKCMLSQIIRSTHFIATKSRRGCGNTLIIQEHLWNDMVKHLEGPYITQVNPCVDVGAPRYKIQKAGKLNGCINVYTYNGPLGDFDFITSYVGANRASNFDVGIPLGLCGLEFNDEGVNLHCATAKLDGYEEFYCIGQFDE